MALDNSELRIVPSPPEGLAKFQEMAELVWDAGDGFTDRNLDVLKKKGIELKLH